jgi:hypothetical protein
MAMTHPSGVMLGTARVRSQTASRHFIVTATRKLYLLLRSVCTAGVDSPNYLIPELSAQESFELHQLQAIINNFNL